MSGGGGVGSGFEMGIRGSVEEVELGDRLSLKFEEVGGVGVAPCVATDWKSGEVLMMGVVSEEALRRTLETGYMHWWSRSRKGLWRKGEESGMVQRVESLLVDDDQDSLWVRVEVGGLGASCHVGYRSCFYREVLGGGGLEFVGGERIFDPEEVYGGGSPTRLLKKREGYRVSGMV